MSKRAIKYSEDKIFYHELKEEGENLAKAEAKVIADLRRYTDNAFDENVWVQVVEKSITTRRARFGNLSELPEEWSHIVRLWVILKSNALGKLMTKSHELKLFLTFIKSRVSSLRSVNKNDFLAFQDYLDNAITRRGEPFAEDTKYRHYERALEFFYRMRGHPSVADISKINVMKNPYRAHLYRGDNKKIPTWKLKILDNHFLNIDTPLHYRVAYWLMRDHGTRPYDVLSFPLECVKELKEGKIGTMLTYVGKESGASESITDEERRPYKIVLLNLNEPRQKQLFDLIDEQQNVAKKLQSEVNKQGFLLTYSDGTTECSRAAFNMSYNNLLLYWNTYVKPLFKEGEMPNFKSFKHTAITNRAIWGTHTHDALRSFANHRSMDTVDSYTKPAAMDHIHLQRRLLEFEANANLDVSFKGESLYSLKNILHKVKDNPFAHQLPGYGFCPDASICGNHFECLGCNYLIPNPSLRDYYFQQAEEYVSRADELVRYGKNHMADDRMALALKFYRLYQRTFDDELKELEGFKEIKLEDVNNG